MADKKDKLFEHDQVFLKQGHLSLAGVDEAGRGPLAGPVVASAVIVRDFSFVSSLDDSKKMTPRSRGVCYEEIIAKCLVGIGVCEEEEIDRINIFQATMKAMAEAISKLKETPDLVLVDGPKLPNIFHRQVAIVNGDALSFSIACASVVAKVTRDRMMDYYDKLYPEYGFREHKGYGTARHIAALKQYGACRLHRKTFEPVRSLRAYASEAGPVGRG